MDNEKGPTEIELRPTAISTDSVSDVAEIAVKIVESSVESVTGIVESSVGSVTEDAKSAVETAVEVATQTVEKATEEAKETVAEIVSAATSAATSAVPEQVTELAKKAVTILDLSGFIASVSQDFTDGDVTIADILRLVPRLAAEIQKFEISGKEKGELALAAVHSIVDTYVPESSRSKVSSLVDTIVPVAIQNVLDIAKGRVSFANAAQAAVTQLVPSEHAAKVEQVAQVAQGCFAFLSKYMKK
jgi:uncharacterized protein YjbJ (UPF0337 family)